MVNISDFRNWNYHDATGYVSRFTDLVAYTDEVKTKPDLAQKVLSLFLDHIREAPSDKIPGSLLVKVLYLPEGTDTSAKLAASSIIKELIKNRDKIDDIECEGTILLHCAAANGDTEAILELIAKGAQVGAKDNMEITPLHQAAINGHKEAILALIAKGADVHAQDIGEETPLHAAAENGHKEAILALIEKGANIHVTDNEGGTPLHFAAGFGNKDALLALIEKGANIHAQSNDGQTPLHVAASQGKTEAILALIGKGANIHAQDNDGGTPLHFATVGNKDSLLALIEKGANIHAQSNDGQTPLHTAAGHGKREAILALIEKGANIHAQDNDGGTPLHLAAALGMTEALVELIEKGANIHAKDNQGLTSLHMAAGHGKREAILALIEKGANIHAQDNHGGTPLHLAAGFGNKDALLALIEKGANIHARDNKGLTPLQCSCKRGRNNEALELIRQGASIFEKDNHGKTPLEYCSPQMLEEIKNKVSPNDKELIELIPLLGNDREMQLKLDSWEGGRNELQFYAYTKPFLVPILIKHRVESPQLYAYVNNLPPKEKGKALFLLNPKDQMAYLNSVPKEERIALTKGPKEAIDSKSTDFKTLSPLTIALLAQEEYYRNIFAQKIEGLSVDQVRVLIPHLSPTHWLKEIYRPQKQDLNKICELLCFSQPAQIKTLEAKDLLVPEYLALEKKLDELLEEFKNVTKENFDALSVKVFTCKNAPGQTKQKERDRVIGMLFRYPLIAEQKQAYQSLEAKKNQKITEIEKKYAAVKAQFKKIEEEFEVEIPKEYLDPVTQQLMSPDECIADPTTDNKQLMNKATLRGENDQWRSPFTGKELTLQERNAIQPAPAEFREKLRKLQEAQAKGIPALKQALKDLGH